MPTKIATFAAGCFWGVQDAFDKTGGVLRTATGYIGGTLVNPTYDQVCKGGTDHIEAVQIEYDPDKVSYKKLLEVFWEQIPKITLLALDYPTRQYMPAIFYYDEEQQRLAEASRQQELDSGRQKLGAQLTLVREAVEFWREPDEYHQHYCQRQGERH